MIPTEAYLLLSLALFTIGVVGVLTRRNVIIVLMSIELILNAVNINLVAFSRHFGSVDGQVFAIFIITDAAAEAAVGPRHHPRVLPQPRNGPRRRNGHAEMVNTYRPMYVTAAIFSRAHLADSNVPARSRRRAMLFFGRKLKNDVINRPLRRQRFHLVYFFRRKFPAALLAPARQSHRHQRSLRMATRRPVPHARRPPRKFRRRLGLPARPAFRRDDSSSSPALVS